MGRTFFLALSISIITLSPMAFAGLGQDESSCTNEASLFKAKSHDVTNIKSYRVHTITTQNGMIIKEYVASGGIVFGVSWHGAPFHPNFDNLFGKHFAEYSAHAHEMPNIKGHRFNTLKTENLTIEMGGHMRSMSGRAYAASLIPAGVTSDEIQ